MDPVAISIGALGLVETLGRLIRLYHTDALNVGQAFVFGELLILQSVLVESKLMIDELSIQPPSLVIALRRCQEIEKKLTELLEFTDISGKTMSRIKKVALLVKNEERLRKIVAAFKSSVLLFRDIATE
jgi:hypothetical protein